MFIISILTMVSSALTQDKPVIDSLYSEISSAGIDTSKVRIIIELGKQFENNYPESALVFYKRALILSKQIKSKLFIAKSSNMIGNNFLDQGKYNEAVEFYLKSLENFEVLNDKLGISKSLNNIGIVYWYQQNYDKTIE